MSGAGFQLSYLRDSKLAPLATSALPAWLWSSDASRIVWANPAGAAIFGAPTSLAAAARQFDPAHPAAVQIARLAATLPQGAPPRLERLREFGAGVGRALTCACSHIVLPDQATAILVVAAERAGADLPLAERVHRLLAGSGEAVAAFTTDGSLIAATTSAQPYLHGTTSLAALGADTLAVAALASGHAAGQAAGHEVAIDRLGGEAAPVLVAHFGAPPAAVAAPSAPLAEAPDAPAPPATAAPEVAPPSPLPAERRHPLRFVWQMDEDGCFTLSSDEFIALIGTRTAAAIGRPWPELAAALELDPDAQVARAIATRDTWSGVTVSWPLDDSPDRLAIELSGLPVFDRDRMFRGYRGFGVCRDLALLTALAQGRRSAAAAPVEPEATPPATEAAALAPAPPSEAAPTPAEPAENIVPFPILATEPNAPALSPIERSAFRELSRKLAQRLGSPRHAEDVGEWLDEGEPPAAPAPQSGTDARPLLDRLSVGILVYRFSHLLYANPAFLTWSGYDSLHQLVEAGGLDELFIEPIAAVGAGEHKPLTLSVDRGSKISITGELIDIQWAGEPAHALVTAAPAPPSEPAKPEPAGPEPAGPESAGPESAKSESGQIEFAELRSILDTATDGVVVLDRQGHILSGNRSAEALFGYDELAGRPFTELFAPESTQVAQHYLDGLTRDSSLLNGGREVIGRVRQGGLIALFMTMGRIGDGAEKLCAVFRDITQWKQAERELTDAKRQAEKASSAKSDFLAKISHEIRTPLNAIIGFSEVMMEERFGPVGNERYRDYLKDIHASGGHLLSLINDLLDLSKIEAGKLELTFTSVALNDLAQQCVAIMQPQANRERVIIRTSLPQSVPQVVADARSVRQIVLNLLSNSIKFTGAGGQVIISTALNDDGEVVLRVRDTGIGMSEQDIVTAMEPFRQIATAGRGGSGGTGLGLPLTKALAEANRASFHLTSAPKEGTLVEIAFPAAQVLTG